MKRSARRPAKAARPARRKLPPTIAKHKNPKPATHIRGIPCWQSDEELALLARLAREVPAGGLIVETGTLYGATAAAMVDANPGARIVTIDLFQWHPTQQASLELARKNIGHPEVVTVLQGDSRELADHELVRGPIELVHIDGGHPYECALADLENFGARAEIIAAHDYASGLWISVTKAVTTFLIRHPEYRIAELVGMLIVLRRRSQW